MKETDTHIYFYGTSDIYSNFHPARFDAEIFHHSFETGRKLFSFNCSEQMFMALKAVHFNDMESLDLIMKAVLPQTQKAIGRKIREFDDEEWEGVRFDYMCIAVTQKFKNIPHLRKRIIESYPKKLVEATSNDRIWGIGIDLWDNRIYDESKWEGENLLGEALEHARDLIMKNQQLLDLMKEKGY